MPEFLLERRLEVLLASLTDVAYVPHLSDLQILYNGDTVNVEMSVDIDLEFIVA